MFRRSLSWTVRCCRQWHRITTVAGQLLIRILIENEQLFACGKRHSGDISETDVLNRLGNCSDLFAPKYVLLCWIAIESQRLTRCDKLNLGLRFDVSNVALKCLIGATAFFIRLLWWLSSFRVFGVCTLDD